MGRDVVHREKPEDSVKRYSNRNRSRGCTAATGTWTRGWPGREDAWVRRARCCPESGRGSRDRRLGRAPGYEGLDARGPQRPATVDGNGASVVDP
ncbi:hypothetical protein ANTPLA_LOCUS3554 [Anthophora plagiata]